LNRIKKGLVLDTAREFMRNCRKLGIRVHGTFMIGLPIETQETIEETIRFAEEIDPFSIQVSIAAPYPGTELYRQATDNGWLDSNALISGNGIQVSTLRYSHLSPDEIEDAVERMYRRFYFRYKPILRFVREMATDKQMLVRRLREGGEFCTGESACATWSDWLFGPGVFRVPPSQFAAQLRVEPLPEAGEV
jgi:radical SAM superfamily enzyme YgiQ (UPF0313 family)